MALPHDLSVVIPVRDRPGPLRRVIGEIDASAGRCDWSVEIIVVDDASSPPAVAPQTRFAATRVLRFEKRRGANAARRTGFTASSGKWIHFHDSDDGVSADWCEALRRTAMQGFDAIITARIDIVNGVRTPRRQSWAVAHASRPARIRAMLAFRNCLGPFGGLTFARTALSGVRFPDLPSCQDWAVYHGVWRSSPRLGVAPIAFTFHCDGDDRISASPRRKVVGMLAIARMPASGPFSWRWRRLYHLHKARAWVAGVGRPALARIMRKSRVTRHVAHAVILVYMIMFLNLR